MHACRAARTLHQGQPAPAPAVVLGLSCSGTHCGHTTLPHGRHGPMHTASALDEAQGRLQRAATLEQPLAVLRLLLPKTPACASG